MPLLPRPCVLCPAPAVPGRSRCADHGRAWAGAGGSRGSAWTAIAKRVVAEEPTCHWGFPGCTERSTEADHLTPKALGGSDDPSNLVGSCASCNHKRGSSLGGQVTKARRHLAVVHGQKESK